MVKWPTMVSGWCACLLARANILNDSSSGDNNNGTNKNTEPGWRPKVKVASETKAVGTLCKDE